MLRTLRTLQHDDGTNHKSLIRSLPNFARITMNLATPAPRVEAAKVDKAAATEAAVTDPARPSESVRVEKATKVEPALAGVKEQVIAQPPP